MRARISLLLSFLLFIFSAASFASPSKQHHKKKVCTRSEYCKQKKSFNLDGHFFLRTQGNSENAKTLTRTRTRAVFNPMSNTQIFFVPQFSYQLGKDSGGTKDWAYNVHEAFLAYSPSKYINFTLGRQVLSYGDQLVIGSLDWDVVGRAFDALKVRVNYGYKGNHWVDFFVSQLSSENRYFFGLYNHNNLGSYARNVEFYALNRLNIDAKSEADSSLWTVGSRVKSQVNNFDYRIEANYQFGKLIGDDENVSAYQVDSELGYNFDTADIRVSLESFVAGKDYDQLYHTGHKFLGLMDLFARKNVWGVAGGFSIKPFDKFMFNFKHHTFFRLDKGAPVYKLNGKGYDEKSVSTSNNIGSEFDIVLAYQISEKFKAESGFGLFVPHRDVVKNIGLKNLQQFGYLQLVVSF